MLNIGLKVKPHHFLSYGNFIVFFNTAKELAEQVSVRTKGRKEKDLFKDLPVEITNELKKLQLEYQLTQKHISKLLKLIERKEIRNLASKNK